MKRERKDLLLDIGRTVSKAAAKTLQRPVTLGELEMLAEYLPRLLTEHVIKHALLTQEECKHERLRKVTRPLNDVWCSHTVTCEDCAATHTFTQELDAASWLRDKHQL